MRKFLLAPAFLALALPAFAQTAGAPLAAAACGTAPSGFVSTVGAVTRPTVDANGELCVNPSGYTFANVAAGQATTTIKSGAGVLHSITFNSAATATNTTVIYDNIAASGTVIGRPVVTGVTVPITIIYNLSFGTGLTIITATANGADMTVVYK